MAKRELTEKEKHKLLTNRFTAPFKGETIGYRELTEEQKKEAKEWEAELERRYGKNKIDE
ncbi:hypothetical protein [uncultured Finegoldia sp.]|uniref:hypothetical protein n=1 Tax=uncultured Finegoldia sp. TaxID=328009 RepID=UPI002623070B|nr:hypothetical protein [uncultured Finegoldia sp.]